ncbi:hypothetical protein HPB48_003138 [Haemaphysalis longicornis]|uniref:Peptidase A2 domain-containing protein n=1 Tax=Haemaphysalis longicornis TaxID=44386 RepID=A0A9J6GFD1_HAELO|nr:hypothetical protein HPB48_003138 [Haemaphysalis longicornis]
MRLQCQTLHLRVSSAALGFDRWTACIPAAALFLLLPRTPTREHLTGDEDGIAAVPNTQHQPALTALAKLPGSAPAPKSPALQAPAVDNGNHAASSHHRRILSGRAFFLACLPGTPGILLPSHDITSDDKKRALLCSVCGVDAYALLRSLCAPKAPSETPFKDIITKLNGHFIGKPNVTMERFRFNKRDQLPGESVQRRKQPPRLKNCDAQRLTLWLMPTNYKTAVSATVQKDPLLLSNRVGVVLLSATSAATRGISRKRVGRKQQKKSKLQNPVIARDTKKKSQHRGRNHHVSESCDPVEDVNPVTAADSYSDEPTYETPKSAMVNRTSPAFCVDVRINNMPLSMEVDSGAACSIIRREPWISLVYQGKRFTPVL